MPELAPDITPEELEKDVRDELRSLPNDLADKIACHLVAAERALRDDEPELAYEHAKVARRFAARIGVVREAVGVAAYHAGQYAEALGDLRAARRLTGSDEYLPVMADCERGLGRPERAIDLVRSPEAERLDRAGRIELAIVESGARRDLGQHDAAVITLQRIPELRAEEPRPWSARLAFAYADALADAGHESAAVDWFERAMAFDEHGETEAAERYAELTGAVIEDLEEDEEDEAVRGEAMAATADPDRRLGDQQVAAGSAAEAGVAIMPVTDPPGDGSPSPVDAAEADAASGAPVSDRDADEAAPAASPGDVPDDLTPEAGTGAAALNHRPVAAGDQEAPASLPGAPDQAPPASPQEPAADTGLSRRTGAGADASDQATGPAADGASDVAAGGPADGPAADDGAVPGPKAAPVQPGMVPAFIEPDFGPASAGDPVDDAGDLDGADDADEDAEPGGRRDRRA
ncbi:hypothetical protein Sru01_43010 [Sphaerisporangium rufum]|uniref:Tetratricopeptide repeat protein n=1 Tax=Sphaerisporangium rufum TaxID=1381558 RepID=A0A919V133_9ACTN|nr:tetratricopeptide repeat protein [Sphaerisporangium rufum]GII79319.1 hypothetical protein Sru01_43010 [Sphaerisporangium rufum]